ncbi:MAG: hypothetical protein IJR36_00775 [Lachnospiraceae bacterium]|nr:hypothetical protein [Lachnospiraceae bacterium]
MMKISKWQGYLEGAARAGRNILFGICLPGVKDCELVLYEPGTDEVIESFPLTDELRSGEAYSFCLEGMSRRAFDYVYRTPEGEVVDPCAAEVAGRETFGGGLPVRRACYRELPAEAPVLPGAESEDLFLYRLHVRGFTMDPTSRIRERGTFAGAARKARYLRELGVTAVELMPCYEFDETAVRTGGRVRPLREGAVNYWGYGSPAYYYAPKNSYAFREDAGPEFLRMVQAFHREGIAVIMEFCFDESMTRERAVRALRHWRNAYGVDGFHVSGSVADAAAVQKDPILADCLILGDRLDGCADDRRRRLLYANDHFAYVLRRYLLGLEDGREDLQNLWNYYHPTFRRLNYAADQHGFTLWDLYSYDRKHNEANGENNLDGPEINHSFNCGSEGPAGSRKIEKLRLQMVKNILALTFLANGVPMIQAGDEMAHTAQGNNNPYNQDNEINWLNWRTGRRGDEIRAFVRKLVDFRREHPAINTAGRLTERDVRMYGAPDYSVHGSEPWRRESGTQECGFFYYGRYFDDVSIFVACNMDPEEKTIYLPEIREKGVWKPVIQTTEAPVEVQEGVPVSLPSKSVVVFVREAEE